MGCKRAPAKQPEGLGSPLLSLSACAPNWNDYDPLPLESNLLLEASVHSFGVYPSPKALHGPHSPPGASGDIIAPVASRMEFGLTAPCRGHLSIVSQSCRVGRAYPWGQTWLVPVPLNMQQTVSALRPPLSSGTSQGAL